MVKEMGGHSCSGCYLYLKKGRRNLFNAFSPPPQQEGDVFLRVCKPSSSDKDICHWRRNSLIEIPKEEIPALKWKLLFQGRQVLQKEDEI